jgi:hypothetical protein
VIACPDRVQREEDIERRSGAFRCPPLKRLRGIAASRPASSSANREFTFPLTSSFTGWGGPRAGSQ